MVLTEPLTFLAQSEHFKYDDRISLFRKREVARLVQTLQWRLGDEKPIVIGPQKDAPTSQASVYLSNRYSNFLTKK